MTDRLRIIEHGIVLQDFTGVTDTAEALQLIARARAFIERQPRGSTLVLTDVAGSRFNQKVIDAMKELAEHHKPWIKASALVGLTPLMSIVFRMVVALTRREIRVCGSRLEAMAYLKAQASTLTTVEVNTPGVAAKPPSAAAASGLSTPAGASPQMPSVPPAGPR